MLLRHQILQNSGHASIRGFAIDVYHRIGGTMGTGSSSSLFALSFPSAAVADTVFSSVIANLESSGPDKSDVVILPPVDFNCTEDGIVQIDGVLQLVLCKDVGVVVPVANIHSSGTDLLDLIIQLYAVGHRSDNVLTLTNVDTFLYDLV